MLEGVLNGDRQIPDPEILAAYNEMLRRQQMTHQAPNPAYEDNARVLSDFARGASYMPYRTIGAPVDLATMAMRPFGYDTEKPVMGSDWLIDRGVDAGIAEPQTGAGGEIAGDLVGGLFDPTGIAGLPADIMRLSGGLMDPTVMKAIFAGVGAKTADLDALNVAQKRASAGDDVRDIWGDTGWFKGPDDKWRFEIDDSGSEFDLSGVPGDPPELGKMAWDKIVGSFMGDSKRALSAVMANDPVVASAKNAARQELGIEPGRLSSALSHEQVFDAYPRLADIGTMRQGSESVAGAFDQRANRMTFNDGGGSIRDPELDHKSTSLHELQHAIQRHEGFGVGGSPAEFGEGDKAYNQYRRLVGEAEARAVQKRMDYTPEQRRAVFPMDDYDVPLDELIVRQGSGGPQMSVPLDMSTEARMARAREQGFDVDRPVYHGSSERFEAFDPDMIDSSTGQGADSIWFTDDAHEAASYGKAASDPDVYFGREAGNIGAIPHHVEDVFLGGNIKEIDLVDEMNKAAANAGVEMPEDSQEAMELLLGDWRGSYIPEAMEQGYDGVRFYNVNDNPSGRGLSSTHTAMFDTKNIRSKNAAFDPAKRDSSNLLASLAAAGLLAPSFFRAFDQDEDERR